MNNFKTTKEKITYFSDTDDKNAIAYITMTYPIEGKVSFDKVFVEPSFRGKKIANEIVQFAVDYFVEKKMVIIATCPYVAIWMKRHPQYEKNMESREDGPICLL